MSPPDASLRHHRVIFTLVVVMGMVVWIGAGFAMYTLPPSALAVIGIIGAFAGGWLAARSCPDLRRGEAAVAGAIAVLVLAGLTELRGSLEIDAEGRGIILLGAIGAGKVAWLGAGRPEVEDLSWPVRLCVAGAISMAVVIALVAVGTALGNAGVRVTNLERFACVVGAGVAGGMAAVRLTPDGTVRDVFLSHCLVVITVMGVWAMREDHILSMVAAPFLALLIASPGTLGAALVHRRGRLTSVRVALPRAQLRH